MNLFVVCIYIYTQFRYICGVSFELLLKQFQYIYENKLIKVKFLLNIQYIIILPRYYILPFENQKIQEEKEETLYIYIYKTFIERLD